MFLSSHTNLKRSSFNKVATSICYSLYSGEQTVISLRQKQPPRGVPWKRCSENMQQIYRRTPMLDSNFIEIALRHGCSPVNLLHIFKIPFPKKTTGRLHLLRYSIRCSEFSEF